MSKFDLKNKVAVITGAAGGIGTFLSREFLSAGAKVVLTSRDLDKLNGLAKELNSKNTLVVEMDIIDPESVGAMVKKVTEHFGRIDILLNNAGASAAALRSQGTASLIAGFGSAARIGYDTRAFA